MLAVLLYHGGVPWVDGGLLGVDLFFVLSGFLITGLLVREYAKRCTIRLGAFWAGRARRLLPALVILLLGMSAFIHFFSSTINVTSVRGDAFSTMFYFANWHFVFSDQGYFVQSTAPSPLLHTWSLAVEEQYYLIWPLIALLVMKKWGVRALAVVAGMGAVASATLMLVLYHVGASTDRLYYGTDTRAQALLVGSCLGAVAWSRNDSWRVVRRRWAVTSRGLWSGLLLALVGSGYLLWAWHALQGQDPFLYQGGFLLVAVAAGAVITVVTSWPGSFLSGFLSIRPLVFLGRISYGVYLYHWPIFLALDRAQPALKGGSLLAVKLLLTFVVATLSWRFVEEPIRQRRWLQSWRGPVTTVLAAIGTTIALVVATAVPAAAQLSDSNETRSANAMPPAEISALRTDHAFTSNPIRFLLLGDSVALTTGVGLSVGATQHYGVKVVTRGMLGCDFDRVPSMLGGIQFGTAPGENCYSWPSDWRSFVSQVHPQVVGLLIGRFELANHLDDGHWVHLGERSWDQHLESEINHAIQIAARGGARVVLFTFPYIDPPDRQLNGEPYPENDPSRVTEWNRLLRQTAARYPGTVTVIPLDRMLDPTGRYATVVDGVQVRVPDDGIHVSVAGGELVQPRVLPEVAELGLRDIAQQTLSRKTR